MDPSFVGIVTVLKLYTELKITEWINNIGLLVPISVKPEKNSNANGDQSNTHLIMLYLILFCSMFTWLQKFNYPNSIKDIRLRNVNVDMNKQKDTEGRKASSNICHYIQISSPLWSPV